MPYLIAYVIVGIAVSIAMYYTSQTRLPFHREIVSHTIIAVFWPIIMVGITKELLK